MSTVALSTDRRAVLLPAIAPNRPQAGAAMVAVGSPEHAALLYPHSAALQANWLRGVAMVRATRDGWVLDRGVQKVRRHG